MGFPAVSACRWSPLLGWLCSMSLLSQAPSTSLRCQIAVMLTVKGRVLITLMPTWSLCLHTRELHIFASVDQVQCMYSGYFCTSSLRDPILSPSILGAPCIPGLTQGLWGLWAPSLLWALCISRTQFPTGQWSLWPHFSLWEVMQLGEFFNELLRDVAQKMKSHHNTIAFLSNYRSNNCKQQLALPSQASLTDLGPWEKV